ncbi:MAG TPA: tripartite tricarboxylate transporter substrate binding protein [Burkholderiaceae bacterium]|nr:tripartite tricarboxylate transporter substrate binding protein [Burkholderiaceae bacterium]
MKKKLLVGAVMATILSFGHASATDKPLRIIVPFQAGSATDAAARIIGEHLGKAAQRSVVVDNKPGAEGLIAAREVIRSSPSGDVLLFSTNTAITAVNTLNAKPFFDPLTDLSPIAQVAEFPFLLVSRPELPFNSAESFVSYAKKNPGKLTYAAGSSSSLIAMVQMMNMSGLEMHHIPYNSEPPAVVDLIGERIDVMFATPTTTMGFLREGKLKAYLTTHKTRLENFPEVPTMRDIGLTDFPLIAWGGFFGPGKMSDAAKEQLGKQINTVLADREVVAALAKHNIVVSASGPKEFSAFVKEQLELTAKVVEKNNLKRP